MWSDEITKLETVDFQSRVKLERERIITLYDNQILEAYQIYDDINVEIKLQHKQKKIIPKYLISLKLESMKYLSNIIERKNEFVIEQYSQYKEPRIKEIIEDKIKEIVRKILLEDKHSTSNVFTEEHILEEIIGLTKCDVVEAKRIFSKMLDLGLSLHTNMMHSVYDLWSFSTMREYFTIEEFSGIIKQRVAEQQKQEEYEKKMTAKYEPDVYEGLTKKKSVKKQIDY